MSENNLGELVNLVRSYVEDSQSSNLGQYAWRDPRRDATHRVLVPTCTSQKYEVDARKNWDSFYKCNSTNFYKDRHYLHKVFPGIAPCNGEKRILLECGCGVGNSVFPLLKTDPNLFVYAVDLSPEAIHLLKSKPAYAEGRCIASVCDIVNDEIPSFISETGVDNVLLLYSLSSINPMSMLTTIKKVSSVLKSGGRIYFRDYGRGDFAQLRFCEDGKHVCLIFFV